MPTWCASTTTMARCSYAGVCPRRRGRCSWPRSMPRGTASAVGGPPDVPQTGIKAAPRNRKRLSPSGPRPMALLPRTQRRSCSWRTRCCRPSRRSAQARTATRYVHLCRFHHRLVHEGGYTLKRKGQGGELCFRRPDGRPLRPVPEPVAGQSGELERQNRSRGTRIGPETCASGWTGERWDLGLAVDALIDADPRLDPDSG
jgi:hypothetical protein